MDYTIGMTFITWVIIIFMLTGVMLVKIFERELKKDNLDDLNRKTTEMFLSMFYEGNFADKVIFLLLHGARLWAIIFTEWYWAKRR
jgi:hypothetical protein